MRRHVATALALACAVWVVGCSTGEKQHTEQSRRRLVAALRLLPSLGEGAVAAATKPNYDLSCSARDFDARGPRVSQFFRATPTYSAARDAIASRFESAGWVRIAGSGTGYPFDSFVLKRTDGRPFDVKRGDLERAGHRWFPARRIRASESLLTAQAEEAPIVEMSSSTDGGTLVGASP